MAYTQRYIGKYVHIQLPSQTASIVKVDLLHQTLKLIDITGDNSELAETDYVLDWPEMKAQHPDSGLGVDTLGNTAQIKRITSAHDLAHKLNDWMQKVSPGFVGYLTILKNGLFAATNGFEFVAYRTANNQDSFQVGKLTPAPIQKGWFYGSKNQVGDSPIKNTILTRPYTLDTCWTSAGGMAVASMDWVKEHIKKNSTHVADPFRWQDESDRHQPMIRGDYGRKTHGRHVIVGGED